MKLKVKLKYNEKIYEIKVDFGENYPEDSARFMFEEGNYACDCNLSSFIQEQCDNNFPKLNCGENIEILNICAVKE